MVEIKLMHTRFRLIGKASERMLLHILEENCILALLEGVNARKIQEKMADANSPASMPIHTKEIETLAPSFREI